MLPLDMFPTWLQNIAYALPFPYMMYAPARLFVKPDTILFWHMLGGQVAWVLVFVALVAFVYKRSEKFLTVNGG